MTPQELLSYLTALFPEFGPYWDAPGNCFRNDDGSYTLHGVFSEFTSFFREHSERLTSDQLLALGAFVSECIVPADTDLSNAAATCFVENIAGEDYAEEFAIFLKGAARKYYLSWARSV
jgi:hypothetical protein